eukprot:TRINITY_DN113765_c0_g1_i1.p1 TRINITY_DN113765_c0_g1~~TRINITY_DN113765_c0_g1_i1.p1  ORF type:complete len:490 (-),score=83.07 TRINITY_DN113765_c0_g1_i1:126-1595(-)
MGAAFFRAEWHLLDEDCLLGPLPSGSGPSAYQRIRNKVAKAVVDDPPPEPLERTLRRCISFCYGGDLDWAPHVRVTVYAEHPTEIQTNMPVYSTLLRAWGVPGFEEATIACKPVVGTDVQGGQVITNAFWQQWVDCGENKVLYRSMAHQMLFWFINLADVDPRKQMLVNLLLQLHEACFNCIGRHREVFEYCIHDFIEARDLEGPALIVGDEHPSAGLGLAGTYQIRRFAEMFLDRHKKNALHAAFISPLKYLYQYEYDVFENLDSHGVAFWVAMLTGAFFPDLQMPFETIVGMDPGWTWGSVDFLPMMRHGDARLALERFTAIEHLGCHWRTLASGLKPPNERSCFRPMLPGLFPGPALLGANGFQAALQKAKQSGSCVRRGLCPYAARFAGFMTRPTLLRCCALAMLGSASWDDVLAPALSELSDAALGEKISPEAMRDRICDTCVDAAAIRIDEAAIAHLLGAAGVAWAAAACEDDIDALGVEAFC